MALEESKTGLSLSISIPEESPVRLEVEDVAKIINEEGKESDYIIIDARGGDYSGGHITGSVNVPYEKFEESLDGLVAKYGSYDYVIFHCMYSEQRGPACANAFLQRRKELDEGSKNNSYILLGGFSKWLATFYDDEKSMKSLVDDFDADQWALDDFGRRVHTSLM